MKRDLEFFGGEVVELELVHIARKLKEALKLEGQFTEAGHDYLVEADKYRWRLERLQRAAVPGEDS